MHQEEESSAECARATFAILRVRRCLALCIHAHCVGGGARSAFAAENKVPNINHFRRILEVFLQVDGNSDLNYSSHAKFKFSGLQDIPKSCFFCVLLQTEPRATLKGTWGAIFVDFF